MLHCTCVRVASRLSHCAWYGRGSWFLMPDGTEKWGHCLLGNHCVDHMAALQGTCCKMTGCTACTASKGRLGELRASFERKTTVKMRLLYELLLQREPALTSQGFVMNHAALQRLEADYFQTRLIKNAFWNFRFFCPYTQTLPDSLHLADLGVFQSILFAVFDDFKAKVFHYLDDAENRRLAVADRLGGRLRIAKLLDQEGVKTFVSNVAHRFANVNKNDLKAPLFKAWEYRRLMLVS
jgi:hypothetical protein